MTLDKLTDIEREWISTPVDRTVSGNAGIVAMVSTDKYTVRCQGVTTPVDCFQRAVKVAICYSGRADATILQNGRVRNTYHVRGNRA